MRKTNLEILRNLRDKLTCSLEEHKDLAPLSTFNAGGSCEFFAEPAEVRDVSALFRLRADMGFPLCILGGGSNVVFADGELEGVVLSSRRMNAFRWRGAGVMEAEGGCPLPAAVSAAMKDGFTGMEFAAGIPGTVGGAVAGNAGAGGESMGDILEEVTAVESDGSVRQWKRGEFEYSYRSFSLTSALRFFAACKMKFSRPATQADLAESARKIEAFRRARAGQPMGGKSAGCVFKNPRGGSAGRLLDECGCKGLRVGDAAVSEAHANFILNEGRAGGADIFNLMEKCRDIVFRKTGVLLEPEIRFVGFGI